MAGARTVIVVGAGPAGMFAAQKIAQAGHEVIILNRDIKPGGLAEYGIYPTKDKMKTGLRKQFAKVLSLPNVHYFGNVTVSHTGNLTFQELRELGASALVFAVGAQGTKQLGLEGSRAKGVYSAKDFVYFYNQLPPFASQDFSTGRRVAVIGMGNVAIDIARWLLVDAAEKPEAVIIVARRGPFEAKFDKKEFASVEAFLDRNAFNQELERIRSQVEAVEQDLTQLAVGPFPVLGKPAVPVSGGRLLFRFLSTPAAIVSGDDGRIARLRVQENVLTKKESGIGVKATDSFTELHVDTMVFAIGDAADPEVGLPCGPDGYLINADPADPMRAAYEVFDCDGNCALQGIYVVGWARKASEGLVGIARHDGEVGAGHVLKYLETAADKPTVTVEDVKRRICGKGARIVEKAELELLARAEEEEASRRGLGWFKFSDNDAMLAAIERQKQKHGAAVG